MNDPGARYKRSIVEQIIRLLMIRHPRILLPLLPSDETTGFREAQKGTDEDDDQGYFAGILM